MATHRQHSEDNTFYFITFTCFKWMNLLEMTAIYDFLPNSINKLAAKGFMNTCFVVMPNHFHMLLFATEESRNLNTALSETKRFLAYEIIRRLKAKNQVEVLDVLTSGVSKNETQKGKLHRVFRHSFDAKTIVDRQNILRVMDYIHHNPCTGKWMLVDSYLDYKYSSAAFYELEQHSEFPIWDFREFIE